MIQEVPGVFFGDDFARPVVRQRSGDPDLTFSAIVGEADEDALDSRALAPERVAAYWKGPDVRANDTVIVDGTAHKVRVVRAVNDGQEMRAWLRKVGP